MLTPLSLTTTDSTGLAVNDVKTWTATIKGQERGVATMLEANEQMLVDVTVPTNTLAAYGTFTLQVIPPKGAAITISRTLPLSHRYHGFTLINLI